MSELQDIFDQIVTIQAAITPPTGEKDIAMATDEWPASISVFPAFVNNEVETVIDREQYASLRIEKHLIQMHLLFGAADVKYSQRSRRLWVEKVHAAFEAKLNLNGTCLKATTTRTDYGVVEGISGNYVGATFDLAVENKKPVTYAF